MKQEFILCAIKKANFVDLTVMFFIIIKSEMSEITTIVIQE